MDWLVDRPMFDTLPEVTRIFRLTVLRSAGSTKLAKLHLANVCTCFRGKVSMWPCTLICFSCTHLYFLCIYKSQFQRLFMTKQSTTCCSVFELENIHHASLYQITLEILILYHMKALCHLKRFTNIARKMPSILHACIGIQVT